MKRLRGGLLLLLAGFSIQTAWYGVLLASYIKVEKVLKGADFLFYYAVGQVARVHGLQAVYNLEFISAAQNRITGFSGTLQQVFLPNHPPFLHPLLLLLSGLDYKAAYLCFIIFLYLLIIAVLPLLASTLRKTGWPSREIWILLIGVALFEPLFISILKGQDSSLLLLGGLLWFCGMNRRDDRMAGLGLALTLIRPQVALVLALPYVFRQRRIFGWFCAGATILVIYSFLQVGWTGMQEYLHIVSLSASGQGFGLQEKAMFNLVGLILRGMPALSLDLAHALGWGVYIASVIGMCALWGLSKVVKSWHAALAVCLSLLAAPHLHYHDLALLAVPLLMVATTGAANGKILFRSAASIPMFVSILFLFSEFWNPARFTLPYLLMILVPLFTWWFELDSIRAKNKQPLRH